MNQNQCQRTLDPLGGSWGGSSSLLTQLLTSKTSSIVSSHLFLVLLSHSSMYIDSCVITFDPLEYSQGNLPISWSTD